MWAYVCVCVCACYKIYTHTHSHKITHHLKCMHQQMHCSICIYHFLTIYIYIANEQNQDDILEKL